MKKTRTDKDVRGYRIDFEHGTLVMNFKFAEAVRTDFGSPQYQRYKAILADFPHLKPVAEAGRKITTTRPNKRLTYENMEKHIWCYPNAEELLVAFETAKIKSKVVASPYAYVVDWFRAQFPNYKDGKACVTASTAEIVPLPDVEDYKKKGEDIERTA